MTDTSNIASNNTERRHSQILFIIGSFFFAFFISLTLLSEQINTQSYQNKISWKDQPALNIWFDSNPPLVYLAMTSRNTKSQMTNRHPLFPYVGILPVKTMGLLGIPEPLGVCLALAFGVGLMSGLFALTLAMTIKNVALMWLSQGLFFASSSFIFWSGICERFPLGSASILAVTAGVAYYSKKGRMPVMAAISLNVISLSITITNWMFGLLMTLSFFKIKTAIKVALLGFLLMAFFWLLEDLFIEQRNSLIHVNSWNQHFIFHSYPGSFFQKLITFLGHTVVIPSIHPYGFSEGIGAEAHEMLGVAHAKLGSGTLLGGLLATTWGLALIGAGVLWWLKTNKSIFDRFLLLAILGQVAFHMVYGVELFLYGLHIAPLILLFVCRGLDQVKGLPHRTLITALFLLVPLLAFHNIIGYIEARTLYLESYENRLNSSMQSLSPTEVKVSHRK
jgi:hypothetical protein